MRPLVKQILELVGQALAAQRDGFLAREAELEARIEELESRVGAVDGRSVAARKWSDHRSGDVVKMDGVVWRCMAPGRWRRIEDA